MIIYYQLFGVVADLRAARQRGAADGAAFDDAARRCRCPASRASSSPSAWRWTRTCSSTSASAKSCATACRRRRPSARASRRRSRPSPTPTSPRFIAGLVLWVFGTGADPRLRHRADARHPHLDVHGAAWAAARCSRCMYGGKRKLATAADRLEATDTRGILPQGNQLPVHGHAQGVVRAVRDPDDRRRFVSFWSQGLNFAIDFTGGISVEATFSRHGRRRAVREALRGGGLPRAAGAELRHLARRRHPACSPTGRRRSTQVRAAGRDGAAEHRSGRADHAARGRSARRWATSCATAPSGRWRSRWC